jgi:ABC-2 type transport system ATP-binding protein
MSIIVNSLSKIYGTQKALDEISFSVNEGEILGFLGPNGAGKSTTMKIATGFLPPTSGSVKVGNFDVIEKPVSVKKIVGYLPENNPLYTDMYVHEYLQFIGSLHGMRGKFLKERTREIVKLCGLEREQFKKIGALSKGYKQRVGLAQALIHDPQVIILDEPTTGLDPNQILEIRELIKQVSKNKTVIFSTHIMQEVQALCSRVVIINKGKIVADKAVAELKSDHLTEKYIVVEFAQEINPQDLELIGGVKTVRSVGKSKYSILLTGEKDIREEIFNFASQKNIALLGLSQEESNLEDIFQKLTR